MGREFWDERYRSHSAVWSGNPNAYLVSEVADLAPGTALDVGADEGADAVWLARRGWTVTAVDISPVALDRAAARAAEAGVDVAARIQLIPADVTTWVPPLAAYDLVSAQFLHLPTPQRVAAVRPARGVRRPWWHPAYRRTPPLGPADHYFPPSDARNVPHRRGHRGNPRPHHVGRRL